MMDDNDKKYMRRALDLAARVPVTAVAPNPRVGAVIVKNGKIIGEGAHEKFGGAHAEINALRSCRISPIGATLYITLEPCCHWGKTPPCTDAIMNAGITTVVCTLKDHNPLIKGKSIAILKNHGVRTRINVCKQEAKTINEPFFHYHATNKPFVAIKIASSLDGKIATRAGDSKWITAQKTRDYARLKIRSEYQAILVGINTALKDNPHLGIRKRDTPDPLRIILDSKLRTPLKAQVLRDKNVILAVGSKAPQKRIDSFTKKDFTIWRFSSRDIPISQLLKKFTENKVTSVLVEGGGETIGRFLNARAVQKIYWFHAPLIIGGNDSIPSVGGKGATTIARSISLKNINRIPLGRDLLTIGYLK